MCEYNTKQSAFYIKSFNHDLVVSCPDGEVLFANSKKSPPLDWGLILLNYLSSAKDISNVREWVTYRQLPHGDVFFPSIKTNILEVLSGFFSITKDDEIKKRLNRLGFTVMKETRADVVAVGKFAPKIPVMIQFWDGEESIPPSFQILFDKTASFHMHMEDLAAICGVLRDLLIL